MAAQAEEDSGLGGYLGSPLWVLVNPPFRLRELAMWVGLSTHGSSKLLKHWFN